MGGMPMPQGAGAIPPTTPVQPQQQGQPMDTSGLAQLSQQQMGQIQQSAPAQEETAARAAAVQKAQEAQQMPLPKTGPQIQKGASVGHNLGQAALMALGVTKYGGALNQEIYGPGERAYALQQAGLKGQETAETERAKGAQQETETMGQVGSRGIYGAAGHEAAAQATASSRYKGLLAQIQSAQGIAGQRNATNMAIAKIHADTATKDAEIQANAHIEGIQDEAAVAAQIAANHNQTAADMQAAGFSQSIVHQVMDAFGAAPPVAAEAQPAQRKAIGPPSAAAKGAGRNAQAPPKGATHIAPGSDGKSHYTNSQGQDLGVAP